MGFKSFPLVTLNFDEVVSWLNFFLFVLNFGEWVVFVVELSILLLVFPYFGWLTGNTRDHLIGTGILF